MTIDQRASVWRLRTRTLQFGRLPLVMGIVNVTPDSFSDGGRFLDHEAAVAQALRLLDDGTDILDIGGESTRPYSTPVTADEDVRLGAGEGHKTGLEIDGPVQPDPARLFQLLDPGCDLGLQRAGAEVSDSTAAMQNAGWTPAFCHR